MKARKEFDNVWDNFKPTTFEDLLLAKATKLRNVRSKNEKLELVEEIINYSKKYLDRLITGK